MRSQHQSQSKILSTIFGVFFLAIGAACIYGLRQEYLKDSPDYTGVVFLSFITVLIGGLGVVCILGVVWALIIGTAAVSQSAALANQQSEKEEKALTTKFGGTLYNTLSNKTVLISGNASVMYALWGGVALFSLMLIPLYFFVQKAVVAQQKNLPIIVYFLAVVIILFFIFAIRATIRWRKFGQSTVEFEGKELKLGDTIKAVLKTSQEVQTTSDLKLLLNGSYTMVTGSGKNQYKSKVTVASTEAVVPTKNVRFKIGIPFTITIPKELKEIEKLTVDDEITWLLTIFASTSGVDYSAEFFMPIVVSEEAGTKDCEQISNFT